ncbi:aldehyde dehydrogenase family protein [Rhizobium sp. LjRoot30]|uniref:aldehyde dehydrogenase family protein n=1 Tax=Rhizobium sp. LjRoot30 TaxID=3342320 RepID=UPI003ED10FD8
MTLTDEDLVDVARRRGCRIVTSGQTTVDGEEEAIDAANGTEFGLVAGIHARDIGKALKIARRAEAGQVTVKDYWAGGIEVPFGGTKKSGFGREKGLEGIDAYTRTKAITLRH